MKDSVIADLRILPLGTESTSFSPFIAACVSLLKQSPDMSYQVTAMSTIIQGPLERVLELAKKMHEMPFSMGANRVVTIISIDDRRDKPITIESKVRAVTEKL